MKRILSISLLILMTLALSGCKSDREKVADNTIDIMDEFCDQLAKIKNNTDLVDAKPALEKLGARLKDEGQKMEKLGSGTAEERAALEKEFKPRMEKVQTRLMDEMQRLEKDLGPGSSMQVFGAMGGAMGGGPGRMKF